MEMAVKVVYGAGDIYSETIFSSFEIHSNEPERDIFSL